MTPDQDSLSGSEELASQIAQLIRFVRSGEGANIKLAILLAESLGNPPAFEQYLEDLLPLYQFVFTSERKKLDAAALAELFQQEKVRGEALAALENYREPEIVKCLVDEVYREKKSRRPRQEVAKQLKNYDSDEAVNALIILLEDEDVFVRDDAAESLLQLNRPRLVEVWKQALNDLSGDVRNIAVKALTDLGYVEEAIDRLVDLLEDKDFFVRDSVAELLLQLNRPRLIDVWKRALNDPDEDVRDIAIRAITDSGEKFAPKS